MKIIHFADSHIGVETYGSIDPVTGLSTRVLDQLKAVDLVIEYAVSTAADLVLFCGDAYKSREPSPTHQREFARRIRRLSSAGIPTVLVAGNHDIPGSPGQANSVEIFDTLYVEHIHIASRPGILNITTRSGDVQVAAFPWLRRNALLAREETRNLPVEALTVQMQDALAARLVELSAAVDPSRPAVLAGHVAVSSARVGTEKGMVIGNDPAVMLSTIASRAYDYVALGHMHRRQQLSEDPPVIYSGSLERLDFGDEGDDKGFYEVDISGHGDDRIAKYEFHAIPARRFLTLEVTVADDDVDPSAAILARLEAEADAIRGAVTRLKISLADRRSVALREADILKALKEAYNVSVVIEAARPARLRSTGWADRAIMPLEALDRYMEVNNVPGERRKILRQYAGKMIEEKRSGEIDTYAG